MRRSAHQRPLQAAGRDEASEPSASPTPRVVLRAIGRVVLWAVVGLLLIRGAADILGGPGAPQAAGPPQGQQGAESWPGSEARAFAADFARAYLTFDPQRPEFHERATASFLAGDLREGAALDLPQDPEDGEIQTVAQTNVARAAALDGRRALITVAATVTSTTVTTRYLTVPVARDQAGGLVVYDYPSFSAPPRQARVDAPATERLTGRDAQEIQDVLGRFFEAYFAGQDDDLTFFLPAGVRLEALGERYELDELVSVAYAPDSAQEGARRTVLATMRATDPETETQYLLRYRVGLVADDRWYVASINSPQED
ncbi:MAG: conjugal transfer protein [Actinomycetota bacterium]|nr:conjugal transfer protein [Actinomycetota bacterium]